MKKPRRWMRARKERQGTPGGEYIFDLYGKHYELPGRFIVDKTSPSDDGLRWVGTSDSNRTVRILVHKIASGQCQVKKNKQCWKWAPVDRGHPHHAIHKKMGGAFADDRIWLAICGETVQIRVWSCPGCHAEHHNPLAWSYKRNVA